MSQSDDTISNQNTVNPLTDEIIRIGLIAVMAFLCLKVVSPFIGILLWALVLAIALYPLHLKLAKKLAGKNGRSATFIVILGLLLVGGPTIMIGDSFANHIHSAYNKFESGSYNIEPPDEKIAEWPLVGKKIYQVWSSAADNLPALIEKARPKLINISKKSLKIAANTAGSIFAFLGSLVIAGIMMAYGSSGSNSMLKIFERLTNPTKGTQLQNLTVGTVRSVATGVIGVAFIQALLLGVGFVLAGIPAAAILALIVMVLGILQLPALLVSLPVIAYLWLGSDASTTSNIVFTIYLLIAGLADNVLKPLLLGRGVDAPMPVVLLGALGGMVSAGIIGLFVGAVLLSVGYKIFMNWVEEPL
jgi:predicted PurR-regulated permease PerM